MQIQLWARSNGMIQGRVISGTRNAEICVYFMPYKVLIPIVNFFDEWCPHQDAILSSSTCDASDEQRFCPISVIQSSIRDNQAAVALKDTRLCLQSLDAFEDWQVRLGYWQMQKGASMVDEHGGGQWVRIPVVITPRRIRVHSRGHMGRIKAVSTSPYLELKTYHQQLTYAGHSTTYEIITKAGSSIYFDNAEELELGRTYAPYLVQRLGSQLLIRPDLVASISCVVDVKTFHDYGTRTDQVSMEMFTMTEEQWTKENFEDES